MAKTKKKLKKKPKEKKPARHGHDDSCVLCNCLLSTPDEVLSEDLAKREGKQAAKDPDYKMLASTSTRNLNMEEVKKERRSSLRIRKVKKEPSPVVIHQLKCISPEAEERISPEAEEPAPSAMPPRKWEPPIINGIKILMDPPKPGDLEDFLTRRPEGVKPKLEFLIPKIPVDNVYQQSRRNQKRYFQQQERREVPDHQMLAPSEEIEYPPEIKPSLFDEFHLSAMAPPINKYSDLLKQIKREP